MIWLYYVLGSLIALAVGLAIYEWRSKRQLLKHDLNLLENTQTETDRNIMRAAQETTATIDVLDIPPHQ